MHGIMRRPSDIAALAALGCVVLAASCSDASGPGWRVSAGNLQVTVVTSGPDPDPDGYRAIVDDGAGPALGPNGSLTLPSVPAGEHRVRLDGIAPNCAAEGGVARRVRVASERTALIEFAVACTAIARGTLRVTTSTTGPDADADGYIVRVENDLARTSAHVQGSATVKVAAPAGSLAVSLLGVAVNCTVTGDGGATRLIHLAAGATTALTFDVTCAAVPVSQLAFVRDGRIHRVNADGAGLVQLSDGPADADPAWSPDGRRIAFTRHTAQRDASGALLSGIHVMDADGSNIVFLPGARHGRAPAWSPDGLQIAFSAQCPDGQGCILVVGAHADGAPPRRLGFPVGYHDGPAWSPDGRTIAFVSDYRAYDIVYDIYVMSAEGVGARALVEGPFFAKDGLLFHFQPAWSPDGRRIAMVVCPYAYDSCHPESSIAVANADGSGVTMIAAAGGYARPTWSPDGGMIAFGATSCRTCASSIRWVRTDGTGSGVIVTDGHSPSWRR